MNEQKEGYMINLIKNSQWKPGPNGGPQFFSGSGPVSYDNFYLKDYRTCSLTMHDYESEDQEESNLYASDQYDLKIPVYDQQAIQWGYFIRAIEAESIVLQADFYDHKNSLLQVCRKKITSKVCAEFLDHSAIFPIPCNCKYVMLSMHFQGNITACTFGGPFAFFTTK